MATDDVLQEALDQLEKLDQYAKTYGFSSVTEKNMVFDPLAASIRLLVGEVQRLRDMVEGDSGAVVSGGIDVFDPNDPPWEQ